MQTGLNARQFYRVASQRFEDAAFLVGADREMAGVYLAGYCVECVLKALILQATPTGAQDGRLLAWRGRSGHHLEGLREDYRTCGGAIAPPEIARAFVTVNSWSVDLRYRAGQLPHRDAELFLEAVERIIMWSKGRLS